MIEIMLADGTVDDDEVDAIRSIYKQLTGNEISVEQVRSEIRRVEAGGAGAAGVLAEIASTLNNNGKELVVKAAFMVAAADGEFQDVEKAKIAAVGQTLGMSAEHVKATIHSMLSDK